MEKIQHTPGPWEFDGKYIYGNELPLLRIHPGSVSAQEAEANARLVATAPEMLEALEAVCTSLGYFYDSTEEANDQIMRKHGKALELAEAAIRKARGAA